MPADKVRQISESDEALKLLGKLGGDSDPLSEPERSALDQFSSHKEELRATVSQIHELMGHANMRTIVSYLKTRKAHPALIATAKQFVCDACTASQRAKLFPVSGTDLAEPGKHAIMDNFKWCHPVTKIHHRIAVLADYGSRHAVFRVLATDKDPAKLGNTVFTEVCDIVDTWMRHFGKFETFRTDPEGCFRAHEFRSWLSDRGVQWLPSPGEAH